MKPLLYYFIQVICISAILYGYYHLALRNKKFHRYNRFYLLAATFLSISIPFLNIPLYFTQAEKDSSFVLQTLSVISSNGGEEPVIIGSGNIEQESWFTFQHIIYLIYILVAITVFFRIVFSLLKIKRIIRNNPVEKVEKINFVETEEPGTPFSFFRWLFWNKKIDLGSDKGEQIFKHEIFHIEQKHSWDIMYMELLVVFCWFNPFFHLMKKEIKAIHEFLADQFAVKENKQWEYAELLLMQALSTQHQLVNPFFHNQIKRRIAMITTSQKPRYQYLRKILVLPVAATAIALFAFSFKNKMENDPIKPVDKPIMVVIDAGHGGEDFGARSQDGILEKDITLAIAQKIKLLNEDKNINIILTREGDAFPTLKERTELTVEKKADLFISIHINNRADNNADKKGFEVFISKKNGTYYPENKILGTIFLNYFSQLMPSSNEVKQRQVGIWVLDAASCPAALLECGYLSNNEDLAFITNDKKQDEIAITVLKGISQYFEQKNSDDWEERKSIYADTTGFFEKISKEKNQDEKMYVRNNKNTGNTIAFTADTIIYHKNPNTSSSEVSNPIYIFNGKTVSESSLDNKLIYGKTMTIYPPNDKDAISKYGKSAENGVVVFEEATTEKSRQNNYSPNDTIKPKETDNIIFEKVEVEAKFPGGNEQWRKYLERNLDETVPDKHKAPAGVYTVVVQFIVDKEGKISDVKVLTKHGYGMEEEAVRVISKEPDWIPAIQNGKKVKAYRKQPITFRVAGNKKEKDQAAITVEGFQNNNKENDQIKPTSKTLNEVVVVGYSSQAINSAPMFPGGKEAWLKYLSANANGRVPSDSGAPTGQYNTIVQFLVHTDGSISDIKAISNFGYGMEKESIRVIEKGPKWIPAMQNGKAVNAYVKQPITYQITEGLDENVTEESLSQKEKASTDAAKNIDTKNSLYPNPSTGIVKIQLYCQKAGNGIIKVINQSGQVVLTSKSNLVKGLNILQTNTSVLGSGVYIITVIGVEGGIKSYKMIKQ